MRILLALLAFLLLGCTGAGIDYSGVDVAVLSRIAGSIESNGVRYYYIEDRGDNYTISDRQCSGYACDVQVTLTTYYMSYYNKVFVLDMDVRYINNNWQVFNYSILNETEVLR